MKEQTHGGKRRGSGRKKVSAEDKIVPLTIYAKKKYAKSLKSELGELSRQACENGGIIPAESLFYAHLRAAAEAGDLPDEISLATYESDELLKLFRPTENWQSAAEHAQFIKTCAFNAELNFGVKVKIKEIRAAEYFEWLHLNDLDDSPEIRATYISM